MAVFHTGLLPPLAPEALPTTAGLGLLVLLHAALTLTWLGGYVHVVSRARSVFERPSVRRLLDRATGLPLIAFGARVGADVA
ncbi:hypothetical protein [Streptomyces mayteni]